MTPTNEQLKKAHDSFTRFCDANAVKGKAKRMATIAYLQGIQSQYDEVHPRVWIASLRCDMDELIN
jgi:hypothetical protein